MFVGFEFEWVGVVEDVVVSFDLVVYVDGGFVVFMFVNEFMWFLIVLLCGIVDYMKMFWEEGVWGVIIYLMFDFMVMWVKLVWVKWVLFVDFEIGIYIGGLEGLGVYGLNWNVGMMIFVGELNRVMVNFVLI